MARYRIEYDGGQVWEIEAVSMQSAAADALYGVGRPLDGWSYVKSITRIEDESANPLDFATKESVEELRADSGRCAVNIREELAKLRTQTGDDVENLRERVASLESVCSDLIHRKGLTRPNDDLKVDAGAREEIATLRTLEDDTDDLRDRVASLELRAGVLEVSRAEIVEDFEQERQKTRDEFERLQELIREAQALARKPSPFVIERDVRGLKKVSMPDGATRIHVHFD